MERIVKDSVQIRFVYGSAAGCSASARKGRRFFGRRQEETGDGSVSPVSSQDSRESLGCLTIMRNRTNSFILLVLAGILMAAIMSGLFRENLISGEQSGTASGASAAPAGAGSVQLLSSGEYEAGRKKYAEKDFSASDLLWQGGPAACDEKSASVYIPFDAEQMEEASHAEKYTRDRFAREILAGLEPADKNCTIYICSDHMMDLPAEAVSGGYPFQAILADGERAEAFHLILTGLPALCIDKTDSEEIVYKEEHQGKLRYIPMSASDEEADSFCRFHVRGNVSSTLDKKPYKISLTDKAGNKIKTGIGTLREDDDWILNPLFTDFTRVREMTAYTLWDSISAFSDFPQASSRMQYVELFMDNVYQGIYGLMEPVDGKQLALQPGDILYKIDRWDREYPYIDEYESKEGETEIYNDRGFPCVEIKYPRSWDRTASWLPMQVFHRFVFRTQNPGAFEEAGLKADLDSIVSMSLYCALTHAMDSTWKNSLLIAKMDGEGSYTLYRTIWDLNFVFGDVFVYAPEEGYTAFDPGTALTYIPEQDSTFDFEAFLAADPSLEQALAAKWAIWRAGGISADSVCAGAEQYMSLLTKSGAMAREMQRWPQDKSYEEALGQMEEWIRARFAYLDRYFGLDTK